MSFPLHRCRDFTSLATLSEEPLTDPSREVLSEASTPTLASTPDLQSRSIILVSPRPALSSWPSFTSTYSSSTNCSSVSSSSDNSKRFYKSKLTADDFLLHAFGSTGRRSRQPLLTPPPSSPSSLSGADTPNKSSYISCSKTKSTKRHTPSQDKRYSLPAPPPSGTFITTKPPKSKTSERPSAPSPLAKPPISVTETEAFSGDVVFPQERPCTNPGKETREPLLTDEQWREKARQRAERRKHLRLTAQQGSRGTKIPLPIDIDCRPMEGSMGLPDSNLSTMVSVSAARKKRTSSRKHYCASKELGHAEPSKQVTDTYKVLGLELESNALGLEDDLDGLVAQSAAVNLSDSPQS